MGSLLIYTSARLLTECNHWSTRRRWRTRDESGDREQKNGNKKKEFTSHLFFIVSSSIELISFRRKLEILGVTVSFEFFLRTSFIYAAGLIFRLFSVVRVSPVDLRPRFIQRRPFCRRAISFLFLSYLAFSAFGRISMCNDGRSFPATQMDPINAPFCWNLKWFHLSSGGISDWTKHSVVDWWIRARLFGADRQWFPNYLWGPPSGFTIRQENRTDLWSGYEPFLQPLFENEPRVIDESPRARTRAYSRAGHRSPSVKLYRIFLYVLYMKMKDLLGWSIEIQRSGGGSNFFASWSK